ncbi:MAG TPA: MaoC/PaaZ C-terminal domain-containing protein [Candidatus Methylomirabilis sp.]|nr:MaoC/PaaZ C-terminal domain-containing protein [Candidatus Methylomirabilis sp.]
MKLSSAIVGATAGPLDHVIDARWLMAYAAGLGETALGFFDTTRPEGIVAHPLFPVCYEWPLALLLRDRTLGDDIAPRGVHATHDLTLYRLPRAGERLRTTAVIVAVEPRTPGAYVLSRFDTVDVEGQPVSTTLYGSLYRGVACDGAPARTERSRDTSSLAGATPQATQVAPDWSASVPVAGTLAHVYSECARIWNPIHTDRAVARAAGLPDIILHGTATLALAVSAALRHAPSARAAPVTRIACRFSAMVRMPSMITVEGWVPRADIDGYTIRFQVLNDEGHAAVTRGSLVLPP